MIKECLCLQVACSGSCSLPRTMITMGTPSTQTLRATPMTLSPSIQSPRQPPAMAGMSLRWAPDQDAVPEPAPTSPDHSCLSAEHTQLPGPLDDRHAKSMCCLLQCLAAGDIKASWCMQDFWGAGLYLTCSAGQIHAPFNSSKFFASLVINPCWAPALPAHLHFWRSAYVLRWMQIQSAKRSVCMNCRAPW